MPTIGEVLNQNTGKQTTQAVKAGRTIGAVLQPSASNPVEAASTFIGTPYRWGGTSRTGIDCSGLTQCVYKNLPRTAAEQWKSTARTTEPQPGDLVFLKNTGGRKGITHVGIYAGNGQFIHAAAGGTRKVILDRLDTPYNKSHFAGYGRTGGQPAPAPAQKPVNASALWEPDTGIGKAVASSVGGYAMEPARTVMPRGSSTPSVKSQDRQLPVVALDSTPVLPSKAAWQQPDNQIALSDTQKPNPNRSIETGRIANAQVQAEVDAKPLQIKRPTALSRADQKVYETQKQDRLNKLTQIVDTNIIPEGRFNESAYLALMGNLDEAEQRYVKGYVEASVRQYLTEPSTREYLAGFLLGGEIGAGLLAKIGGGLATKGGAIGKAGQKIVSGTQRVEQAAKVGGIKGAVTKGAVRAVRGAGENVAFEAVGAPERLPESLVPSLAMGAGAAVGLGALGDLVGGARLPRMDEPAMRPKTADAPTPDAVHPEIARAKAELATIADGGEPVAPAYPVAPAQGALEAAAKARAKAQREARTVGDVVGEKPVETPTVPAASGKPGAVVRMKTKDIGVDPSRFQFRMERNPELENVKKWDVDLAGVSLVWEDPATGKTWVVNGHHRLNLANRLKVDEVDVRYINAKTAAEARVKGALVNIAEGRASAVDAAKLFRDSGITPENLTDAGVSLTGKVAADGMALSKLNDNLFNAVIQGKLTQDRAAAIGRRVSDSAAQDAVYALIQKKAKTGKPLSAIELDELTRRVLAAPDVVTKQVDLFGASELKKNLAVEEAQLSGYIREQLRRDKTLFGRLSKEAVAKELERGRNIIEPGENARIAAESAIIDEVYSKLSGKAGSVSDILHAGAERIAAKENINVVKAEVYRQIREEVSAIVEGRESGRLRSAQVDGRTEPTPTSQTSEVTPTTPAKPAPAPAKPQFEPTPAGKQGVMEGMSLADTFELTSEKAPASPFKPKPTAKQAGQTGMFDTTTPAKATGAASKTEVQQSGEPVPNADGSIFHRLVTEKEKASYATRRKAMADMPDKPGYEKVYKPYGEQGRGLYYAPKATAKPTPKPEGGTGATAKASAADAFAKAQEAKQAGKLDEASKALDDVADAALRRIEERNKGRVKAGVDPFDLADITIYTAAKIAKGAVDSASLAAHLAEKFGPEVAKRARQVWDDAVTYLKNAGHDVSGFKWAKAANENDPAKYAGSVNLSKWDTVDDIKTWARETYERNKGEIDEQRRGVRTHEETIKASRKSGMAAELVKTIKPGTALNAEHVYAVAEETIAAETKAISLAKRLEDIREGKLQGNIEVAEAEALKAQADADLLFKVLNGTASEAGRALEIHKVVRKAYEHAVSKPVDIFEPTGPAPAPIKIGKPITRDFFAKDGRLFKAESARAAWERLKTPQKSYFGEGTVMGGIPVTPQMIADLVEAGGYLVDRGTVEFGAWAARLKRDLSEIDLTEPVLREVWEKIRVKASELSEAELAARARMPKTLKGESLKQLRKLVGGKENITQDMLGDLARIDDTDVVSLGNFLRKHNKVGWGTRVEQYGYSGMFSGTNPHWRNLIGNITQGAMIPVEKVAGFAVDAVRVPLLKVFGVDAPRRYYMGELPAAAKAYFGSFPKGAKSAWQVMKNGMNAAELERKIEINTPYDLPDVTIKGKSYMNPINVPFRMLGAIDEWARTMWKAGIEQAHEIRAVKSGKPVRADLAEYAEAESMYYAQMEPFSKFMEQVADVVDYAIPKDSHIFPGMRPARLLVPVFRTATNMLRKAWFDYSPLGTVKALNKEAWVTGEASKIVGKSLAGTAAITTGIYLYSQGKLTGKAPDGVNERKMWYAAGNQPYTIQIGDKKIPFMALGIVGLQWAAISDYLDMQERLDAKAKTTGEVDTNAFVKKLAASIDGQASAAPFFAGINQLIDFVKATETATVDLAGNLISRTIPASGLVRQVARATDPTVKETGRFKDVGLGKSIKEKVMSDIPGLSKKVPSRVDPITGGKTVRQNVGGIKGFFPYTPTELTKDPVIREMMRLDIYPSGAGKSFKSNGKTRNLTRAEYQRYERNLAVWYSSVALIMKSEDYKSATDERKTFLVKTALKTSHDMVLNQFKQGLVEPRTK